MRALRYVDLTVYYRAFMVYARNPVIALAPLAAEVISAFLIRLGGIGGVGGLLISLIEGFAISVSLIVADFAWRYGQARFDQAWEEARRKTSEILMATLGLGFALFAARLVGGILGPLQDIVLAVAVGFLVYTLPATALGGIPGSGALQVSVERARGNPAVTIILTSVILVVYLISSNNILVRILALGYISIILAKVYSDVSYGRR